MDASDLVLLDAIITEGSITEAARKLGEPKATFSRRLQRLEKAAGGALFDRISRSLRPTPLGLSLSAPASAVRVAVAGARSIADAARMGEGGTLRIAAPFLFGRLVMAPLVGSFMAGRTDVKVHLRFDNNPVDPLREDLDIAVQVPEPTAPYLVRSKLATATLKLYAAPKVALAIRSVQDLEQIAAIKTSNEAAHEMRLSLSDGHRAWKPRLQVLCTVNDPEAACFIATNASAVAALPEFLARTFVARGELAPVLPHMHAGKVDVFAATTPYRLGVPLVAAFMTALKKHLKVVQFAK